MTILIAKSSKEMRFYGRNSFVHILRRPCLDLDEQKVSMAGFGFISNVLNFRSAYLLPVKATEPFRYQFLPICKNDDKLPRSGIYFDCSKEKLAYNKTK